VASVSEILRISGLKEGAYYRVLKALVDGGFISRKQNNKGCKGFGLNTYKVLKSLSISLFIYSMAEH
jgi:DNA-binding IclR family transcriptional regulator